MPCRLRAGVTSHCFLLPLSLRLVKGVPELWHILEQTGVSDVHNTVKTIENRPLSDDITAAMQSESRNLELPLAGVVNKGPLPLSFIERVN